MARLITVLAALAFVAACGGVTAGKRVQRLMFVLVAALTLVSAALGILRPLGANGVQVTLPDAWLRVASAGDGHVTDPRTLLVVGTTGVRARTTSCQIAAYRVPAKGAVVVIVGWRTATSGGGNVEPGRWPLKALTSVKRPSFECYAGRGAAASLVLGRKAYQVNVMVGDHASKERVAAALAVARSFRLAP